MNEIFDKEEWASRKQQDREAAYAMVDDTLKKMGTNGKAFQTYLDVQSKFERYSVSNALLVAAQKPEATDLGDANFWRGRGGYIRKGESGILLMEPGNSYTRKDGSKGVNIHIKRVFDISQTTLTPTKQPAVSQDTRLLLNAMVRYAPCKVDFRDELPDGQSALYSPQEKTVFVRRGQSMEDVFRGVPRSLPTPIWIPGTTAGKTIYFSPSVSATFSASAMGSMAKVLPSPSCPRSIRRWSRSSCGRS